MRKKQKAAKIGIKDRSIPPAHVFHAKGAMSQTTSREREQGKQRLPEAAKTPQTFPSQDGIPGSGPLPQRHASRSPIHKMRSKSQSEEPGGQRRTTRETSFQKPKTFASRGLEAERGQRKSVPPRWCICTENPTPPKHRSEANTFSAGFARPTRRRVPPPPKKRRSADQWSSECYRWRTGA